MSTSFRAMTGVAPAVASALELLGVRTPTAIQVAAMPVLARGLDVVLCAETGSGKTLAFLAPFLSRMVQTGPHICGHEDSARGPGGLVVVPTRELAQQTSHVFNSLARAAGCLDVGSVVADSGVLTVDDRTALVIGTPRSLLEHGVLRVMPNCRYLVVDEADFLLADPSLAGSLWSVVQTYRRLSHFKPPSRYMVPAQPPAHNSTTQLVFAGATLSSKSYKCTLPVLKRYIPGLQVISSPGAHETVPQVEQRFLNVLADTKLSTLLQVLNSLPRPLQVICFVNTKIAGAQLTKDLRFRGFAAAGLYGGISADKRLASLLQFRQQNVQVLVATDLAARGLDLPATAVVQYDFAQDATAYLHRVGRTARGGQPGLVVNLTTPSDQQLVKVVQQALPAAGHGDQAFAQYFSRNRSLRHTLRKVRPAQAVQ